MEIKKPSENGAGLTNGKPKVFVPNIPFESRASRILKAALNHKTPSRAQSLSRPDDQVILRRVQQVEEQKGRKRSPKNSVAFTDPVVSVKHEYEPTYLDEINQYESDDDDEVQALKITPKQATPMKGQLDSTSKRGYTKDNTKKGYGGVADDDDDDDDIFILARSDDIAAKEEKLISRVSKVTPKRNFAAMRESDEDEDSSEQQAGSEESSSGGLFSSPKVAKIAPFYDDRPHERRAAEVRVIQQNRARAQKHMYQRSLSAPTRKPYLQRSSVELNIAERARRPPSINLQTHDRVTELLSYKKVSSPKLGDRNVMHATEATHPPSEPTCKTEQQMPGYFNWFTSFITSQMNKLIF